MKKYLAPFIVALIGGLVIVYALAAESRANETYKKERWDIIMSNIEKTEVAKVAWQSANDKLEKAKDDFNKLKMEVEYWQIEEQKKAEGARQAIQQACAELGIELKACLGDYYENIFTIDPPKCGKVVKRGWDEKSSYWVQRAYEISGCNADFIATLEAENGTWDSRRQSTVFENGQQELSWGFCQIHCPSKPDTCGSSTKPTWEGFYDQEWQLAKCWEFFQQRPSMFHARKDPKRMATARYNLIFE